MRAFAMTLLAVVVPALVACSRPSGGATTTSASTEPVPPAPPPPPGQPSCHLVEEGFGPVGTTRLRADVVVSGLEVPWSIAFLPGTPGDFLVSERAGRVRLVRGGALVPEPVAVIPVSSGGESGLLGIALHPAFAQSRTFYAYYTATKGDTSVNRIGRYVVDDRMRAREERVVFDDIPAATVHDGGRLRFGADGLLYVGTGDARSPDLAQDPRSPAGKILRLTPDGAAAQGNPQPGSPAFVRGIRNMQAFDWLEDGRIILADHGPSGDLGRQGHDEVSVAGAGQNLGWPGTWGCERRPDVVTPLIVFRDATPPAGAVHYRGDAIPGWKGSFVVATLASKHLHRFVLDEARRRVTQHEVYLHGERPQGFGRLRDVVAGPDGALYVTTSNCDGRGTCPPEKDAVLRITAEAASP